ncbi:MAG: fibronectin type III domain-containing protein [Flavobacteriales bacterium]|nr:fibronectin type III domain-containing protein [Flavobacteriales bacterium]
MANLKKGLSHLPAGALVAKAEHVYTQLTAHAATFPSPNPTLAALAQAKDELLVAIANALDGGRRAHQMKRDAYSTLLAMLKHEAEYVANVAKGDAQLIMDGGFTLRAEATPTRIPDAPASLEALTPEVSNAVKIEWKGGTNVRLYQVQMSSTDPATNAEWVTVAFASKRKCIVPHLEPYRMYWFRVIAMNVAGESRPSDVLLARAS